MFQDTSDIKAIAEFEKNFTTNGYTDHEMTEEIKLFITRTRAEAREEGRSEKKCPRCDNVLSFFISDDFYSKGKKFFSCDVCGWKPNFEAKELCKNGCDGVEEACSECPPSRA